MNYWFVSEGSGLPSAFAQTAPSTWNDHYAPSLSDRLLHNLHSQLFSPTLSSCPGCVLAVLQYKLVHNHFQIIYLPLYCKVVIYLSIPTQPSWILGGQNNFIIFTLLFYSHLATLNLTHSRQMGWQEKHSMTNLPSPKSSSRLYSHLLVSSSWLPLENVTESSAGSAFSALTLQCPVHWLFYLLPVLFPGLL